MNFLKKMLGSFVFGYKMSFAEEEGGGDIENLNDIPDDQLDDAAWLDKRGGATNVRAELKRRQEETAELKTLREEKAARDKTATTTPAPVVPKPTETTGGWKAPDGETVKYPIAIQRFYDKMMAKGYDKDWIQGQCDMSFYTTSEAINHSSKLFDDLKPVQQDMYDRKLDKITAGFKDSKDKDTKLIATRFAKEIEEEFKKLDVKKWGEKDEQETIIAKIRIRHNAELNPGGIDDDISIPGRRMPSETGGAGGGAGSGAAGLTEDDLREAAQAGQYDLSDPKERKAAIDFARARKEREKARAQFIS